MVDKIKLSSIETIFVYSSVARRGLFQDAVNVEIMPLQKIAPVSGFFTHGEFHHTNGKNKLFNQSMTVVMLSESIASEPVLTNKRENTKGHSEFFKSRFFSIIKVLNHLITAVTQELKETVEELNQSNKKMAGLIEELRTQKRIVEISNKGMLDSIRYAKKIQHAILPPDDLVDALLGEHFIFYRPKDIVSGDFYWVSEKANKIVCAVADCTGHGVPGAFMSMLGISLLNEIIGGLSAKDVANPAIILQRLREKVKKSLHQTHEIHSSKDGMDIALCVIDHEAKTMSYAGAFNPLYLVRNDKLIEIKADRSPIGVYLREKNSFTNHVIELQDKDMVYLATDGFKDQIGGPLKRKLVGANFKRMLLTIEPKSINEQKAQLEHFFEDWKKDAVQIDDILVVGFRINLSSSAYEFSI
jgi:serine phosphatase RsbU (regulator of sigma subunit)